MEKWSDGTVGEWKDGRTLPKGGTYLRISYEAVFCDQGCSKMEGGGYDGMRIAHIVHDHVLFGFIREKGLFGLEK